MAEAGQRQDPMPPAETIGCLSAVADRRLRPRDRALLESLERQIARSSAPGGSPPSFAARATGWCRRSRRSAAGCAATCTTGSAPRSPR
ncbi:hypothetical protein ACFQX7_31730 [Luedemannella flava]